MVRENPRFQKGESVPTTSSDHNAARLEIKTLSDFPQECYATKEKRDTNVCVLCDSTCVKSYRRMGSASGGGVGAGAGGHKRTWGFWTGVRSHRCPHPSKSQGEHLRAVSLKSYRNENMQRQNKQTLKKKKKTEPEMPSQDLFTMLLQHQVTGGDRTPAQPSRASGPC